MNVKKCNKRINAVLVCLSMLFTYAFSLNLINVKALTDYENYLSQQGFPESYWGGLKALHEKYPNWIFVADKIPLNWNDVVNEECVLKRNLVQKNSKDSWKSFEFGAYDFDNNCWIDTLGGGSNWVAASREIITYYLDPRSYFNESSIFAFMTQSYDENAHNIEGINKIISGTFMANAFPEPGYSSYSEVLLEAARQSRVNPYVLASMIKQEQGISGSSPLISGTYPGFEGYYNFFNVNASGNTEKEVIENGLIFARGSGGNPTSYNRPWNTRAISIIGGSIKYGESYVNVGQNTLYFKKFDVVNPENGYYWHQYMQNVSGAESEARNLKNAYANVTDSTLKFNIPVYINMPQSPSIKPVSEGNNNNLLKSLSINGNPLTPSFSMYITDYQLVVDMTTYSINIQAEKSEANAAIISPLTVNLADGNNTVPITVSAPSGATRTYTLNIYKQPNTGEPVIASAEYKIDTMLSNVSPGTSLNDFLSKIKMYNCSVNVLTPTGSINTGNIATGDKVQVIQNNTAVKTYDISVNGDINGDGNITTYDLLKIQKHILNVSKLSGIYLAAADYNKDGNITAYDCLKGQKYILKA